MLPISEGVNYNNTCVPTGDWVMGESPAPLSLNLNYSDGGFPVCKVCGKVFKHQGSLVAHYQVSENPSLHLYGVSHCYYFCIE